MKNRFLFLLLLAMPFCATAKLVKANLSDAINDKSVRMSAVNVEGRFKGKTTNLTIANNTKNDLDVKVNLGIFLKPDDSNCQPMLLAGGEQLTIKAGATREITVMTFCGNAPKNCPEKNLRYSFSHVGNDDLIKVLEYIKANSLYDFLGQSAVWAMTNGHELSDLYDDSRQATAQALVDYIIKLTGRKRPDYYAVQQTTEAPGQPAYVPKPLKIIAKFEIGLDAPKTLTLGVFNDKGEMIQKVFENKEFGARGHRFEVEFEAADVPSGKYYIRIKEYDNVLQEKMVDVK